MLDMRFIRENLDFVTERLSTRGDQVNLAVFRKLDDLRRSLLLEVEGMKARRNSESAEIGKLKKQGLDTGERQEAVRSLGEEIKAVDDKAKDVIQHLNNLLLTFPNIPHESVPVGTDEKDNELVREWGKKPMLDFEPLAHWDLGEMLGIIDLPRAAKIAGARFSLLTGAGARLERALINFMLDLHTGEHGYREVLTPFMVQPPSMLATGQLPKFADDLFSVEGGEYYLVPTAEVPVTNIHREEILNESDLPIYYAAYSPCFRREAGSHGKDTRGIIRLHQFNKVELVKFTRPEDSYDELEALTRNAEEVLRRLGLHYRVVNLATGDLGFSAAKTYDLEVWLPGQEAYREISSCSNFEDFQARRAQIRFRPTEGKGISFVHTINGSGLAVGRCLVAILENYQQADGTIVVPEVLRPYMGGLEIITRND
ncbi:MAG: serine--tRNA ligase [bacterium]|nr:serine--tRNA ligase [bacterium]MDT8367037.1 serine--tRNA ligase [bacterium]